MFLNTVRLNLGQSGFVAVTTSSTTEALELAEDKEIDVIVCDYELSQMDGISLFEKIKESRGEQVPPTLIVAEQYAAPLLARCVSAGTAGLHAKTEDNEILIDRIISTIENTEKRNRIEASSSKRAVKGGTDPLTKVAGKQHFTRRFSAESVASYRDANHISILAIAIDRYSRIEEMHGSQWAESTLAQTARLIEGELRSRDCVGRYADHTFGIVLPETSFEAAAAVGKRLKRIIAATEFGNLDHPITITVSAGVGSRKPGMRLSPNEMMSQALKNSAAAQSMGGDKVVADAGLTGKPVTLLLGSPGASTMNLVADMEACNVEVRLATTSKEAQKILEDIPTAIIAVNLPLSNGDNGTDFLTWAKSKFPTTKRILIANTLNTNLLTKAINEAEINYYLPSPWKSEMVSELVEQLIYA